MKMPRQRSLRVRVDYEPNRFSGDCLERIYEQLHPTTSRKVTADSGNEQGEAKPQKGQGNPQ